MYQVHIRVYSIEDFLLTPRTAYNGCLIISSPKRINPSNVVVVDVAIIITMPAMATTVAILIKVVDKLFLIIDVTVNICI